MEHHILNLSVEIDVRVLPLESRPQLRIGVVVKQVILEALVL
jgi:hypothetical protein